MERFLSGAILILYMTLFLGHGQVKTAVAQEETPTPTNQIRCHQPQPEHEALCQQWEEAILAQTVRVRFSGWVKSGKANSDEQTWLDTEIGHGTVQNGRYLVTHNHYQMPFDLIALGRVIGTVSLYTSNGTPLLTNAQLQIISIAYEDSQSLVLEFATQDGKGLFEIMGIPSATFQTAANLAVQPGHEIAQIDWNGNAAHVDWVTIKSIGIDGNTPVIFLNNFNQAGSSGGGVFWQGFHIANTWQHTTVYVKGTTSIVRQYSSAALNSNQLVNQTN